MGVYGDSRTKLTFLLFRTLVKLNDLFCCLIIYCNPAEPIQTLFRKMNVFELVGSPARMGKNSFATCLGKTVQGRPSTTPHNPMEQPHSPKGSALLVPVLLQCNRNAAGHCFDC